MLRIGWMTALIALLGIDAQAADHLGFHYVLDAVVYERTTPTGPVLHFEAVQHPVWKMHEDDERLRAINDLCGKESHNIRFGGSDVVAALPAVTITDPMNERQIVEMLAARAGNLKFDPKKDPYTVDMHFYQVQFPDQRYPVFNLTYIGVKREPGEKASQENRTWTAVHWKYARPLQVKDYGSKRVVDCIQKRVTADSFKWEGLIEADALKDFIKGVDCETPIAMINPEEIFILPPVVQSKLARDADPSAFLIPVRMDCFLGDVPCEE